MANPSLVLPALRGSFGDWIFYSCLMPVVEIGSRVHYAHEIHPDAALSKLIQRSLEGARAKHIAEYLTSTKERFFNALVLATYGGSPEWLEIGNFRSTVKPELLAQISERSMDTLGFLSLSGAERIFAVDGQHRVAGIKRAIKESFDFGEEQLSVLLVAHRKTQAGLQRTRRLFTTLNKTAVAVRKRDIIALDEDDVMAIIARRLVETNPHFRDPKIAVIASQNIPSTNHICLTTISSLYDTLKLLFRYDVGQQSDRHLRFNRPSDERLDEYYEIAVSYFTALGRAFPPVGELLRASNPGKITEKHRGDHGGHLLFRPIGLDIMTQACIAYATQRAVSLPDAVLALKAMPINLAQAPFRHVIWDPVRKTIITNGKTLARQLVKYLAGLSVDREDLEEQYGVALTSAGDTKRIKLPAPLFR
jgi:DNA sulfur modification protein DndB